MTGGPTQELERAPLGAPGVALRSGIYAILDVDRLQPLLPEDPRKEADLLLAYTRAAVDAGAVAVQLRAKSWPVHGLQWSALLGKMLDSCGERAPIVVNDAVNAAQKVIGRAGLGAHVGQGDVSPITARHALGPEALIGLSTHTVDQVRAASAMPLDYLGFGPVRRTDGKDNHDPVVGVDGLRAAVQATRLPVVAIGGLGLEDIEVIVAAGARSMAVIGGWLGPRGAPHDVSKASLQMSMLVATWIDAAAARR